MAESKIELKRQFDRVITNGWLEVFQNEAQLAGTSTAHLLAIGSRETNLKNIKGDKRNGIYHGYCIMQVDIGTDPEFCKNFDPEDIEGCIKRGVKIYLSKTKQISKLEGKGFSVNGNMAIGAMVDPVDIRRIATAAYNCGLWAYYHFSRGKNCDSSTTGHNYSRDVYDRAVVFASFLDSYGIEKGAVIKELDLQGKYASKDAQAKYNHQVDADRVQLEHEDAMETQEELARKDYQREPTGTIPVSDNSAINNPTEAFEDVKQAIPDTSSTEGQENQSVPATLKSEETSDKTILQKIDQYGDRFQGLNETLGKFGISDESAGTSFGTWVNLAIKYILGSFSMAIAFLYNNPIWILPGVTLILLAMVAYNISRNRVWKAKAGVPKEMIKEMMRNDSSITNS